MIHTRHLLMHVYPVRGNGVWQRNLDAVLERMHLFNGSKTLAVVTDETTDGFRDVLAHIAGCSADADHVIPNVPNLAAWAEPNNPSLREVVTHESLWRCVPHEPGHATFYCHAKGVSHPVSGLPYWPWANLLYEANLDYWPWVEEVLSTHAIAGALLKDDTWWINPPCPWHYSGSFYWIRNETLSGRDWRTIDQQFWGVETWPCRVFSRKEAGLLFWNGGVFNPADHGWFNRILDEWNQWRLQNPHYRTVGPLSNSLPPNSSKG